MAQKVGFIGIGFMGSPMAANLVRGGFDVIPWDTQSEALDAFAQEHGLTRPDSIADLARASVIVTMLPTGAIVRDALTSGGENSLAAKLAPGTVVIDMSSSEPVGTQELAAQLADRGVVLIDAPVSGGVARAIEGTLAIMIGSDDDDAVARVEPVLKSMGQRLFRTGGSGSGHATKALNNLISATNFTVASEAMLIGRRFGLDSDTLIDVINNSTGRSFATEIPIKEHALTGKFGTGFALGLMAKDVQIAWQLAEALGMEAPVGKRVHTRLMEAAERIGPAADHTRAFAAWEQD